MKFNKIVKVSFIVLFCISMPAQCMWSKLLGYVGFSVAVESEPEWWVELEASIAKGHLHETENLLNQMTNTPGFLSDLNYFSYNGHAHHSSYTDLASTILQGSIEDADVARWGVNGRWYTFRPLSLEKAKRIISLLFTYKRINFKSSWGGMEIICRAAQGEHFDIDYIKYLYAQGIRNITNIFSACRNADLDIDRRCMLFEFFMERLPHLRMQLLQIMKDNYFVELFEKAQRRENTKDLQLLFAYAARNDHIGNYVAHIMNRGYEKDKQQMLDLIKETIKHEYCNEHFQNDFQKTLVAALKNQQYFDVEFCYSNT